MRRFSLCLSFFLAVSASALAQDLPQGPKAPPPDPLPEPGCDTAAPSDGGWLLGRWVAPYAKWQFTREAGGLVWSLEQKPDVNRGAGWKDGARFGGKVVALSGCTLRLEAREGDQTMFAFDGVLTPEGRVYGYATNPEGQHLRWILRRER